MDRIKVVHDEQIVFDVKFYLEHGIEVFFLLCDTAFFLLKSSIEFTLRKRTPHDFSESIII